MTFADNLKRIRHEAGLTQFELAEHCDISYKSVQRYEQGKCEPKPHVATRMATALGITVEQLKAVPAE